MGRIRGIGFALALASIAFGCDEPTSIAVRVTSDLPCTALKGVTIQAGPPGAPARASETTTSCRAEGDATVIGTLVLVPGGSEDANVSVRVLGGVDVAVEACKDETNFAGCIVARRTLRFVPGRETDLPIILRGVCKGVACDGTMTCVRGACATSVVSDPARCSNASCDEGNLFPGGTPPTQPDGGIIVLPDGGTCGSGEKICDAHCVSAADPAFGCTRQGCAPCAGDDVAEFGCGVDTCLLVRCKDGFKNCGGTCVPLDVAHGCGAAACAPCESANGSASCDAIGACAIACNSGFKPCGGKCVSVDDPTYGCTATGCTADSCPDPGAGTLVCASEVPSGPKTCVIGKCPSGTKDCNKKCVPTDATNGCEQASRCTACSAGEVCQGAPTVCTCIAEALTTTCATKSCGTATNNCGKSVTCANRCVAPNTCGGGGAGPNGCGCTSTPPCDGQPCYTVVVDNCGASVQCVPGVHNCFSDPGGGGG